MHAPILLHLVKTRCGPDQTRLARLDQIELVVATSKYARPFFGFLFAEEDLARQGDALRIEVGTCPDTFGRMAPRERETTGDSRSGSQSEEIVDLAEEGE
eukprot:4224508-Pleurochrysis_carterae.AAC.4